jgi:hypothetical protein
VAPEQDNSLSYFECVMYHPYKAIVVVVAAAAGVGAVYQQQGQVPVSWPAGQQHCTLFRQLYFSAVCAKECL